MGTKLDTMTKLQGTYSVFTGTDIYTVFQDQIISTMQGLSYSITRQKAPIYTMGSPDPRAFARSKRGIAGSMIMTTFDRHCLADFMSESTFAAKLKSQETNPKMNPFLYEDKQTRPTSLELAQHEKYIQGMTPDQITSALSVAGKAAFTGTGEVAEQMSVEKPPMFTDQLLPFDSTLMGANEYGIASTMRIYGLEILNEGSGVSIDDTSNEVQMTYIARLVSPWINQKPLEPPIVAQ